MSRFLALPLVAAVLAGCAALGGCATATGGTPHVSVLGPWSEGTAEAGQFRAVLGKFEDANGVEVDYTGTSAVAQVLQSDLQKGTPPDLVVLSGPGDVLRYRGDLKSLKPILGEAWRENYSPQWQDLVLAGFSEPHAVPIRANLKGLIWYNRENPPGPAPRTFAELSTMDNSLVAEGKTPWCLGVAAQTTSGWPGTDWIEDILLHQSGAEVYRQWVSGKLAWDSPPVKRAWRAWGSLVTKKGQVLGGVRAALLTEFGDAARPMFEARPRCLMAHQASFMSAAYTGYDQHPEPGKDFDFFTLPSFSGSSVVPQPVSADMAGVINDTPQAKALIKFLISRQAQEYWPTVNAFSASARVLPADYRDPVSKRIATSLTGDAPLCFDGSDLMPASMRAAFYRAVEEYLSDPSRLTTLLDDLDEVRATRPRESWLTVACG